MNLIFYSIRLLLFVAICDSITLNKGRYEDVYIVIQDSVPEDENLLTRIKAVFTEASMFMFEATERRAYFGNIKIVIPKTWTSKTEYTPSPSLGTLGAHITIADGPIKAPYVLRSSVCGSEGRYMHLKPSLILAKGTTGYGKHANVIVHEWGHLRWGLFDEYPTIPISTGSKQRQNFYQQNGKWKPVRCTEAIQGNVGLGRSCQSSSLCDTSNAKNELSSDCYFCVDIYQDVKASLMGYQYIEKLSSFCDKDDSSVDEDLRHNGMAPNFQNIFCKSKSAWEVMREHTDFYGGANPPLTTAIDTTPQFVLIQETSAYMVFVLDVSGSMGGQKINTLYETCKYIIQDVLSNGSWVGVVWFNLAPSVSKQMTQVTSQQIRSDLIDALPTTANGGTCIGCGITTAVEVLKRKLTTSTANGQIIVVSDGKDGDETEFVSGKKAAKDGNIVVHTIAISQVADPRLEQIATETGGKHFTYFERNNVNISGISLASAFSEILTTGATTVSSAATMILSETVLANANETVSFDLTIDSGIGIDTKISVRVGLTTNINLELVGPNSYTQESKNATKSVTVNIPERAKAGKYRVSVSVTLNVSTSVECDVTSRPVPAESGVIRVSSWLSSSNISISSGDSPLPVIYAAVTINFAPIKNATATAQVVNDNSFCYVDLLDNGNDPDTQGNDGTYAGYILLNCLANGRASIKVQAHADGYAKLGSVFYTSDTNADDESTDDVAIDAFERVTFPGIYMSA